MTHLEYAKLNAYNDISIVFDNYREELELIPGMPEIAKKFQEFYKDLNSLCNQTMTSTKTYAETRRQKHEILIKKIYAINHPIAVWAQINNEALNPELFHLSEAGLQQKNENDLCTIAKLSISEAQTREKMVVPDFISETAIAELQKATDDFKEIIAVLKKARKKKTNTNVQIRSKIKELDLLLKNKIDWSMTLLKLPNPAFYQSFKEARRIKNKTYEAKALFNDIIRANTTQTLAEINYQPNNWLLIKNKANMSLSIHLSSIKDIALGEGVTVPAKSTIYRQVRNLHSDENAKYLIAKNDDKKDEGILEIWMG